MLEDGLTRIETLGAPRHLGKIGEPRLDLGGQSDGKHDGGLRRGDLSYMYSRSPLRSMPRLARDAAVLDRLVMLCSLPCPQERDPTTAVAPAQAGAPGDAECQSAKQAPACAGATGDALHLRNMRSGKRPGFGPSGLTRGISKATQFCIRCT